MNREKLNEIMVLVGELMGASALEYRCVEAEWNQHDRILRLFVDRKLGSDLPAVGMDDCVLITRALNESTDVEELVRGAFNLEVSSPGVERPLRLSEDFTSHVGQAVEVRLREPVEGIRKANGELMLGVDGSFQIEVDEKVISFALENVLKAHLVYDWSK